MYFSATPHTGGRHSHLQHPLPHCPPHHTPHLRVAPFFGQHILFFSRRWLPGGCVGSTPFSSSSHLQQMICVSLTPFPCHCAQVQVHTKKTQTHIPPPCVLCSFWLLCWLSPPLKTTPLTRTRCGCPRFPGLCHCCVLHFPDPSLRKCVYPAPGYVWVRVQPQK